MLLQRFIRIKTREKYVLSINNYGKNGMEAQQRAIVTCSNTFKNLLVGFWQTHSLTHSRTHSSSLSCNFSRYCNCFCTRGSGLWGLLCTVISISHLFIFVKLLLLNRPIFGLLLCVASQKLFNCHSERMCAELRTELTIRQIHTGNSQAHTHTRNVKENDEESRHT